MPLFYLRRLTGKNRTETANRHLARYLAFVAGATNAGGFLAVHRYTSHMSGVVSAMADDFANGDLRLVLVGFAVLLSFLFGALLTTLLVRWARKRELESEYALPLIIESFLLLIFGFFGQVYNGGRVLGIMMLLSFTMGLQNAIITKISDAVIRTTHLTGMVTDIGIALGRLADRGSKILHVATEAEFSRLQLLASLVALFFIGGVIGALGFKHVGFFFTLPLAAVLLLLAGIPVLDDVRRRDWAA
ncbi:MAG TPA: YoaK family protein [Edaphobacter sp.]|nr:YoaK family protein [Edaphobacter sp.]